MTQIDDKFCPQYEMKQSQTIDGLSRQEIIIPIFNQYSIHTCLVIFLRCLMYFSLVVV